MVLPRQEEKDRERKYPIRDRGTVKRERKEIVRKAKKNIKPRTTKTESKTMLPSARGILRDQWRVMKADPRSREWAEIKLEV